MEVMFEVVSRQKFSLGEAAQHVFSEVGGYIGRDEECEWVLPDKTKQISRRHALISFDQTSFQLEDLSSNGIFNPLGRERLNRNQRYKIEHGATYIIGDYTIQARLLHKPDNYLESDMAAVDVLIPDDIALNPDPLVALEQEDEISARRRLGMYSDLLGATEARPAFQSDHATAPLTAMPSVTALPEDWAEEPADAPGAASASPFVSPIASVAAFGAVPGTATGKDVPPVPPADVPAPCVAPPAGPQAGPANGAETEAFFRALGYAGAPATAEERERMLGQAAELLLAFVDGMLQSLRNRADSKNDLRLPVTTMTLAGNNPLKFCPSAKAALDYLLAPPVEGMLPSALAVLNSYDDLHGHNMGLLAGARATVRAVLERVGPTAVEAKLDASGPVRFHRDARLWDTYTRMYRGLHDDHDGFAAFFLEDFARAYEMQVRTLLTANKRFQGDK